MLKPIAHLGQALCNNCQGQEQSGRYRQGHPNFVERCGIFIKQQKPICNALCSTSSNMKRKNAMRALEVFIAQELAPPNRSSTAGLRAYTSTRLSELRKARKIPSTDKRLRSSGAVGPMQHQSLAQKFDEPSL